MGRLAVILGSNALGPGGEEIAAAAAEHGRRSCQRHDAGGAYVLPHRIDHAANLRRWSSRAATGCWRSARSARCSAELAVGSLVCPDDFIALQLGVSALRRRARPPAAGLRPRVARAKCSRPGEAGGQELRDGGVYWQTIGPRFETPAEIR